VNESFSSARGKQPSAGTEECALENDLALERCDVAAGIDVVNPDAAVGPGRRQMLAVRGERQGLDAAWSKCIVSRPLVTSQTRTVFDSAITRRRPSGLSTECQNALS
jgi:hypothetical protein